MPFEWKDYLNDAKLLVQALPEESRCRSCVSRAYYAAYGYADAAVRESSVDLMVIKAWWLQAPKPKRISDHEAVWFAFMSSDDPELAKVGKVGLRLKTSRTNADYFVEPEININHAREAMDQAEAILKVINVDGISQRLRLDPAYTTIA